MNVGDVVPLPRRILDAVARLTGRSPASARSPIPGQPSAFHPFEPMKIHIVCYEEIDDWILGKIARRLHEGLQREGMRVTLGKTADHSADINHHVVYFDYEERAPTLETVMVTHINDERELGKVRRQLIDQDVDMGICMSFEAVHRMAHFGIPRHKLCYVSPAHDEEMRPRPTLIGLTTRLYPDGCKREHLLEKLAERISPADFRFMIMGSRWEAVIARLRARGFEVRYVDHFDPALYRELMPTLDYYLYLGRDEGSMGFLDALAAGVPTIVTPQGFHLDVPGGISYPVDSLDELYRVFEEIARAKKARAESVATWTWSRNVRSHLLVWDYLRRTKTGDPISEPMWHELEHLALVRSDGRYGAPSIEVPR
jgi:hypothetical protein